MFKLSSAPCKTLAAAVLMPESAPLINVLRLKLPELVYTMFIEITRLQMLIRFSIKKKGWVCAWSRQGDAT